MHFVPFPLTFSIQCMSSQVIQWLIYYHLYLLQYFLPLCDLPSLFFVLVFMQSVLFQCQFILKSYFLKLLFIYLLNLAKHTNVFQDESFFLVLMSSDHTFISFMLSHLIRVLQKLKLKSKNSWTSPPEPPRLPCKHLPLLVEHFSKYAGRLWLHSFSKDQARATSF